MNYARGTCGHIKARWDSHYNCLSCSSCSRFSTCTVCSQWSENAHVLPNPATSSRMILPLEPDFSQMSDPSIITEPSNTWRPNDKHSSQTRQSCKEQSKRRHRSKKKRRHRLSFSSSPSRSASSDSHKKSKKSKRSKNSHKRRRRLLTSSSSSLHST